MPIEADEPIPISERLDAALAGEIPLERVAIEAECASDDGWRTVEIDGSGLAFYGRDTQVRISSETVRELLETFRARGFAAMPPVFGVRTEDPMTPERESERTSGRRSGEEPDRQPPVMTCRVKLRIDDAEKQVRQLNRGEPSEDLLELAGTILDTVERAVPSGVTVNDLADGLKKLDEGVLVPESLSVTLLRGELGDRWILRIRDGAAHLAGTDEDGSSAPLPPHRIRELATVLTRNGFAGLPQNLYGESYTSITVRVIGFDQTVVARPFQGMDPEARLELQDRFERIVDALLPIRDVVSDEPPSGS